jgi:DeoR family suf operon transcriptional repressor
MERTRDQVTTLLYEQGWCSVSELAEAIGVGQGAIRRHLDIMVADGLLDTTLERQPRGRPATYYSLSEAGEERSTHSKYSRLLERLFPALSRLPEEEITGRSGSDVLERVFERMAEDVATEYAPHVSSSDLGERVQQVTAALRDEGILQESSDEGAVYRLRNVGCPYRSAAQGTHMACKADRRAIELLLGAPVDQVTTIVDGAACCEYVVAK